MKKRRMEFKSYLVELNHFSCIPSITLFRLTILFFSAFFSQFLVHAQGLEITQIPFPFKEIPNSIVGVDEDAFGNLWMAARNNGLFKYDGSRLVHYKSERNNTNSLLTNRLETLLVDKDGTVWIGTHSGLAHFNPINEKFTNYPFQENDSTSVRSNVITALAQESSGGIWVGTNKGLDFFDPKTKTFKHHFTEDPDENHLQKEHIRSLYIDKGGLLWIGCGTPFFDEQKQGGLFKLDSRKRSIDRYLSSSDPNSLIDNRVKAIFEDSRGTFWVGTAGDGLHTMNREEGTFKRHTYDPKQPNKLSRPPQKNIYDYAVDHIPFISEDADGHIWIGTFGAGLNRYDPKTKMVQHFGWEETGQYHIPHNSYWTSLITQEGLLWLATWDSSAFYKISTLNKVSRTLLGNWITSFVEDGQGTIYMLSDNELFQMKIGQNPEIILKFQGYDFRGHDLELDKNGSIWISTYEGLHHYNPKSEKLSTYKSDGKNGLQTNNIRTTKQLNSDSLLVGTFRGLYLLDTTTKKFTHFPYVNSSSDRSIALVIRKIFIDSRKDIWIATDFNSLKKFDLSTGQFANYNVMESSGEKVFDIYMESSGERVFDIYETDTRKLYIGSSSGLSEYNIEEDRFHPLHDRFGILKQVTIGAITAETDSILWLESNKGLVKYNTANNTTSSFYRSWGYDLPMISHFGFFKSSEGYYYKGIPPGYYKFRFSDFNETNASNRKPFIGKLLVENKPKDVFNTSRSALELPHNQNNISFELGYINYQLELSDFKLQYSLGRLEENWSDGAHGEMIRYHSLAPGNYEFKIRAMDVYGKWHETSQAFQISPPWWGTWWAYLCYFAIAAISLFSLYRFQLQRRLQKEEALRLKELNAFKSKLYTNITHEFRTPLTVILGMANQVMERPKTHLKKGMNMIIRNGQNLLTLVNQMLDLSKLENGKLQLAYQQADVISYLKYIAESFHSLAENKGIRIHFKSDVESLFMDFDETRLQQIVSNLLTNAIKFMPKGGRIDIDTDIKNDHLIIKIKDTGAGISKEDLPHIFDRFYQVDASHTRHGEGTGIGLALTQELVRLMKGSVSVTSSMGEGSTFIVELPISRNSRLNETKNLKLTQEIRAHQSRFVEEQSNLEGTTAPSNEKPVVLIADDNEDVRTYIASCLKADYSVKIATNGPECEERAIHHTPDLIVLDVMMPYKDGFEVCHALKTDERTSHIPIIMLTAKADMESKLEGLEQKADDYLTKPFHKKELLLRIKNLLELRQMLQQYYRLSLETELSASFLPSNRSEAVKTVVQDIAVGAEVKPYVLQNMPFANSLDNSFVSKVKKTIEEHLDDSTFDVEKLCREVALSNSQVHRKLSALTGLSATYFIRYIRLLKAKELLLNSTFKISAIATDCGFNDAAYFSRVFKKEFGTTPQQWRNQYLG